MLWAILGILCSLYLLGCGILLWGQRRMIFVPQAQPSDPRPNGFRIPHQSVQIPTPNGQWMQGWWFANNQDQRGKTLLFLHGNGGLGSFNFQTIALWHEAGYSVLAFHYRGYGASPGSFPQETQVYQDAIAAYDFLRETLAILPEQIVAHGHSLGGAIAIELASHRSLAGLFLESTFTSMHAMSKLHSLYPIYRIFPISFLLRQRFESGQKLKLLSLPIFFCHGCSDPIVPFTMSETLLAIATGPKELKLVTDADHHNLATLSPGTIRQGIQWIESQYAH